MKRFWIMLLAVAVALAIALPAGAKKPPKPEPEPEPRGGYTCVDYGKMSGLDWQYDEAEGDPFPVTLGGDKSRSACIDVMSDAGVWKVTVTGSGASGLALTVRDSIAPGDVCFNEVYKGDSAGDYYLDLPSSHLNACGWKWGEQGIAFVDGEWVDSGEPLMGEDDEVPHPLAFIVRVKGSPNAQTTISVDLPDLP